MDITQLEQKNIPWIDGKGNSKDRIFSIINKDADFSKIKLHSFEIKATEGNPHYDNLVILLDSKLKNRRR